MLKKIHEALLNSGNVTLKRKESNRILGRGIRLDKSDIGFAMISLEMKGKLKRKKNGQFELI